MVEFNVGGDCVPQKGWDLPDGAVHTVKVFILLRLVVYCQNIMIPKSSLLFVVPLAVSVLGDGDYAWQAPSSTDRKSISNFL